MLTTLRADPGLIGAESLVTALVCGQTPRLDRVPLLLFSWAMASQFCLRTEYWRSPRITQAVDSSENGRSPRQHAPLARSNTIAVRSATPCHGRVLLLLQRTPDQNRRCSSCSSNNRARFSQLSRVARSRSNSAGSLASPCRHSSHHAVVASQGFLADPMHVQGAWSSSSLGLPPGRSAFHTEIHRYS